MHSSVMIVATRVSDTAGFGSRARSVPGDRSTDPDRLRIRELANSLFGQLAAIAGGLDAPEGKPRVALHHAVDEYLPSVELVHQAIDLLRILGEGGRAQAELRVVGERDGVVEPLRAYHRGDRAEDLFLPDLGPLGFEGDGRLASSGLEGRLLQVGGGGSRKAAARPVAAGQGGGGDPGILDDLLHFLAADEERLEAPLGIAGVAEDLLDGEGALRNAARVLEQADVPGHEGRSGETEDLPEREVPGHDGEHRAEWLEPLLGPARVGLDGLRSEVALGVLRIVAAAIGALLDLGDGGLAQLSHLQRHQAAESVLA